MKKVYFSYGKIKNLIAILLYIATCSQLFYIQKEYADTLLTAHYIVIGFLPVACVFSRYTNRARFSKENSSASKVGLFLLIMALLTFVCWLLHKNVFYLAAYQLLVLLAATVGLSAIEWRKRKQIDTVGQFIMTYSALLITTTLYLVILKPCTVDTAQKALTRNGYGNASLIAGLRDKSLASVITGDEALFYAKAECGMYHFTATMNDEAYNIFIDVLSGDIIGRSKVRQ